MEEKLRTTLADLTERERQVAASEAELAQLRQKTVHEAELRKTELEQMTRIQLRDMESKLKLEAKQTEYWRMQVGKRCILNSSTVRTKRNSRENYDVLEV